MISQRLTNYYQRTQSTNTLTLHVTITIVLVSTLAFLIACNGEESISVLNSQSSDAEMLSVSQGEVKKLAVTVVAAERDVAIEEAFEAQADEFVATPEPGSMSDESVNEYESIQTSQGVDIALQTQERIIVRNADMRVQTDNPSATVDAIGMLAISQGGWIVERSSSSDGFHYITIRVPAQTLDAVITQITNSVVKVETVKSTSTDFTEEFIDLDARRTTVQETVNALTELLKSGSYNGLEDLLEVQREITDWQTELEKIDGRLRYIRETAAFSRLTVTVNRTPIQMRVDVGDDVRIGLETSKPYTARFYPPEGYDRFEITWDFGDGTGTSTVWSAIQIKDAEGYLTAPAVHTYTNDEFSPYVVSVNIKAFSDTGTAEGEGKMWAYVSELPTIDPFLTAPEFVEEKQEGTFIVTFNNPPTIRNMQYSWDFRDGSEIQTVSVEPGVTSAEITHTFNRWRFEPYEMRFEIWGDSDAGEVREKRLLWIDVRQALTVDSPDFAPADTATRGLNTLISFLTVVASVAIWIGTTSPIWIILAIIIYIIYRIGRGRLRRTQPAINPQTEDQGRENQDGGTEQPA